MLCRFVEIGFSRFMAYFLDEFSGFVPCLPYSDRFAFFVPLFSPFCSVHVKDGGFTVFASFFVLTAHFDFPIRVPHGERSVVDSVFFHSAPAEPSIGIESGPFSIRLIVLEASFVNEFPVLGKANGFLLTGLAGGFGELKPIRGALQAGFTQIQRRIIGFDDFQGFFFQALRRAGGKENALCENCKKSEQWNVFRASVHGFLIGGADRDRTDDLHNAIVALFQLSYGPNQTFFLEEKKKRSSPIL